LASNDSALAHEHEMIFRLSQKLSTKIKAGTLSPLPSHANSFADWSAHIFTADRAQYILLTNTKSLYSTVMHGKGITSDNIFIQRALGSIREFMEDDGQEFTYRRLIAPASASVRFAKAIDRSVTGCMNDLVYHATMYLIEEQMPPHDVGFRLNGILFSSLARPGSSGYARPREAFKALMSDTEPDGTDINKCVK
jgi:hypothetical protein